MKTVVRVPKPASSSIQFLLAVMMIIFTFSTAMPFQYAGAASIVDNDIEGDVSWSSVDSPYEVQGNLTIMNGASLTIGHGSEVIMQDDCWIHVEGKLLIHGTPMEPVTIRSSTSGSFDRINFTSGSQGIIEYGNISGTQRGINAAGSGTSVNIFNSTVWSSGQGLSASSQSTVRSVNTTYHSSNKFTVSGAVVYEGFWFDFRAVRDTDGKGVEGVQVKVDHKKGSQQEFEEWTAFDSITSGIETDYQGRLPSIEVDRYKHNGFVSSLPVNITMKWSLTDQLDRSWGKNLDDGLYANDNIQMTWEMDYTPPPPPTNLRAVNLTDTTMDLIWDQEMVLDLQDYVLTYKKVWQSDLENITLSFGIGIQPYTIYDLTPEETYVFELRALDFHSIRSAPATATIKTLDLTPPETPDDLHIQSVGGEWVHLKWGSSSSSDVVGYQIEIRAMEGELNYTFFENNYMNLSMNVTGLPSETEFKVRIMAFDDAKTPNPSEWSPWVSFTTADITPPLAPVVEFYPLDTIQLVPGNNFFNTTIIGFTISVPDENRTVLDIVIDGMQYEDPDGEIDRFTTFKGSLQYFVKLDAGHHTFNVRSIDPSGNIGPFTQTSLVIDRKDPVISSDIPSGSTYTMDQGSELNLTVNATDENGIHSINWTLMGEDGEEYYHGEYLSIFPEMGNYTLKIRAYDVAGNWALHFFDLYVRTPDLVPPEIIPLIPSDGAVGVDLGPTILLSISEELDENSIQASLEKVTDGSDVEISVIYDVENDKITAYPLEDLEGGTQYLFKISSFKDISGNDGGPFSLTFTTISSDKIDTDSDGIPDYIELQMDFLSPSDPLDAENDQDKDGLSNVDEYIYGTFMDDSDSDDDGMTDGWEVEYGLDPLNLSDATIDSDNDGHSNLKEFNTGTDPLDPESKPEAEESSNVIFITILIFVILLLLAGVVIFLVLIVRRNKAKEEEEEKEKKVQMEKTETEQPATWSEKEEVLKRECSECGATLDAEMEYCPECGAIAALDDVSEESMDEEMESTDEPEIPLENDQEDITPDIPSIEEGIHEDDDVADMPAPPSLEEINP